MGKFSKTLIASDFDGTLTTHAKEVPPSVREAIAYYIENGGFFTVCTGRTLQGFPFPIHEYINAPALLANGAMAYDYHKKEIAFLDGIGDEGVEPLRGVRDLFPSCSIELYSLGKTFAVNLNEQSERHFTGFNITCINVDDPADADRPWAKAMVGGDRKEVALVQEYLRENHPGLGFLPTTGGFLEVMKKGTDKGTGLHKLADFLGVPHAHAYAVGDGYNDVEMLKAAAISFVPENGDSFSKAAGDRLVRSNEEGAVAHVIEILDGMY